MITRRVIYTVCPKDYHASYYYRVIVPLTTLEELGLGVVTVVDDGGHDVNNWNRIVALTHSDVNLMYQATGPGFLQNMKVCLGWKSVTDDNGNWRVPPSFVIDSDDNLFDVTPLNFTYKNLGIRGWDGEPLKDGDSLNILEDGKRRVMYRDGHDGFDIARNRENLDRYREIVSLADCVTCSTPHVEQCYQREASPRSTHVFPNSVRFDHYQPFKGVHVLKDNPNEVRVLWQGSPTHYEDLYALRHPLAHVARKYPNFKLVVWGTMSHWMTELIDPSQVEHIRWVPYSQYKLRLCTIAHDINLAPLRDTRFGRCRSAIKFYEAAVLPNPVVTLAQRTGAYADDMIDGETGSLFDDASDFADKLSALIENETERKRLASNAKDWLTDNRDAFKTVPKLWNHYLELRERKLQETPRMDEAEIVENRKLFKEQVAAQEAENKAAEVAAEGAALWTPAEVAG